MKIDSHVGFLFTALGIKKVARAGWVKRGLLVGENVDAHTYGAI